MPGDNKIINATTILALLSAYIYFVWFEFENGICTHYKIPDYFITPSMTGLLIFAASIISVLFTSFKLLGISTPLFRKLKDPTQSQLHGIYFLNGLLVSIGILMIYAYPFTLRFLLLIICSILLINLFTWGVYYLIRLKQKKPFAEKITEAVAASKDEQLDFLTLFEFNFTRSQLIVGIVLIILPFVTYILGMGFATSQSSYQVLSNKNNIAILKKYDDLLLCRTIDTTTRTFSDSLIVLRLVNNTEYVLIEHKGRIKMK